MQTLNWCDRSSRLIKSPSTSMTASKSQQHHSQTFSSASIRQGIGTASTGAAAAVAGATDSNATSSPPTMSAQHTDSMYEKKSPYFSSGATAEQNDATDNSCLTSPNKLIMPAAQKSPSESLSSKTDTDGKKCGGKARNKEGTFHVYWPQSVSIYLCTNSYLSIRSYQYQKYVKTINTTTNRATPRQHKINENRNFTFRRDITHIFLPERGNETPIHFKLIWRSRLSRTWNFL